MLQQPNMLCSTTNKAKNEKRELFLWLQALGAAVIALLSLWVFVVVIFSLGA